MDAGGNNAVIYDPLSKILQFLLPKPLIPEMPQTMTHRRLFHFFMSWPTCMNSVGLLMTKMNI